MIADALLSLLPLFFLSYSRIYERFRINKKDCNLVSSHCKHMEISVAQRGVRASSI